MFLLGQSLWMKAELVLVIEEEVRSREAGETRNDRLDVMEGKEESFMSRKQGSACQPADYHQQTVTYNALECFVV